VDSDKNWTTIQNPPPHINLSRWLQIYWNIHCW